MNSHFLEVPLCDLPITLPPYTSELNPVEVQCRSIRKATGNRLYESTDEMKESIRAMLDNGEVRPVKMSRYLT